MPEAVDSRHLRGPFGSSQEPGQGRRIRHLRSDCGWPCSVCATSQAHQFPLTSERQRQERSEQQASDCPFFIVGAGPGGRGCHDVIEKLDSGVIDQARVRPVVGNATAVEGTGELRQEVTCRAHDDGNRVERQSVSDMDALDFRSDPLRLCRSLVECVGLD